MIPSLGFTPVAAAAPYAMAMVQGKRGTLALPSLEVKTAFDGNACSRRWAEVNNGYASHGRGRP